MYFIVRHTRNNWNGAFDNLRATFTAAAAPGGAAQTSRLIADYLGARNTLLLAHQPNRHCRLAKLKGGGSACSAGSLSVSGLGAAPGAVPGASPGASSGALSINTGLPLSAAFSERKASFRTSLRSAFLARPRQDGRPDGRPGGRLAADAPPWDVWAEGHVARFDDDTSDGGLFSVIYGGADYRVGDDALVGFMLQFDWLNQDYGGGATIEGTGWMVGPYATLRLYRKLYADMRAAWGRSDNRIRPLGTYKDSFSTERWLATGALIGDYALGNWSLQPALAVQYIRERQFAYTDSLGVRIPEQSVWQGDVRFSPRLGYTVRTEDYLIRPWVELAGVYTFGGSGRFTNGSLAAERQGFSASVKAGIDINGHGVTLNISAQYDGIGSSATSFGGTVRITVALN